VTGVVVSGLSTDGTASLEDLGLDVAVALLVSFTLSFELTLLVAKSVLGPVDDLLEATERVKRGSLDARVPLTSGDEVGELAGSFNEMMQGLAEREALREAFGSYVDPEVAERVLEEGELIEAQERDVTIMFVDIRDFTSLAERSSPSRTVAFLSDFFELVVPIVKRRGGHANKFLGDGVLAVFGAPERLPDHAPRAVEAATEIVEAIEERFGEDLRIGVGINSGTVVLGSVGGGGRLEFAVVGDPVNVAARVEAATRETGDAVLMTEATRRLLPDPGAMTEPRGDVPLKGKSEPVPVYSLSVPLDERTIPQKGHIKAGA
jgi:adenylate cyclase